MLAANEKESRKNGMNRKMRRASEKEGRRVQKLGWNDFKDVTDEAKKKHLSLHPDSTYSPDRVFQNNKYIVQVFLHVLRQMEFSQKQ